MESYTHDLSSMFKRVGADTANFSLNSLTYQASYIMLKSNLSSKQYQHNQLIYQMDQPAYLKYAGIQPSIGFNKWVNPSCPRPGTINQSTVVQKDLPWWEKASNKIVDSAKTAGNKIVDGAKTTGRVVNENSREISSAILDFTPIVGNIKAGYEATHGVDPITKRELEDWEQTIMVAAILGGGFVKAGTRGARGVKSVGGKSSTNLPSNFGDSQKLEGHFLKHGREFKGLYKNSEEYLLGARQVIKQGEKVQYSYKLRDGTIETRTGYVKFMGNTRKGEAKFEFVGTNNQGNITTYHVESGKDFWKMLNGDKRLKVIDSIK
ncbi:pre-toxin TG domain-containing protein [Alkalihalophilus lindianensis]|uniref:Pre-toxin TG domain-containing protein n=1 Tax=Alkalihalophilus lindianensis TaxID=1630542 RepID=A0ABU3XF10_9BACI|nr:pre-toxin TG domain-containing protein [Alkalihalophilus lindianensis]MDV2686469.1 pre-toxin TG domain-containing protein [Alkalihalophilus lindianensis]